jgi:hypothetical protein
VHYSYAVSVGEHEGDRSGDTYIHPPRRGPHLSFGLRVFDPPPSGAAVPSGPIGDMRHLAVVPSGESKFSVAAGSKVDVGRVFDQVVKWYPTAASLAPLAKAIQRGINWLDENGRSWPAADSIRFGRSIESRPVKIGDSSTPWCVWRCLLGASSEFAKGSRI